MVKLIGHFLVLAWSLSIAFYLNSRNHKFALFVCICVSAAGAKERVNMAVLPQSSNNSEVQTDIEKLHA
jgi:hypothetical protein